MKSLYLLRHAKSSWDDNFASDRERPLNARGEKSAPLMGQRFCQRGENIDLILSSPAKRARDTAALFASECRYLVDEILLNEALYFLGPGSIEELIRLQSSRQSSMMLVFHNPDITTLVNSLDYRFHIDNVPTCGLLKFDCDIKCWSEWSPGCNRFEYYDYPKNISNEVVRS